jgi:hypothetical protein
MTETGTGPTQVMGRESRNLTYRYFSGAYFGDADTPESIVQFLQYLQKYGIGLELVFGTGVQDASVAPAGTFLRPKATALPASRVTTKATALEKWLSPGTPRTYLQRVLSRQKLLML